MDSGIHGPKTIGPGPDQDQQKFEISVRTGPK